MSQRRDAEYGFDDGLPIDPISPGSTVLVAGSSLSRSEDLALSMVANGPTPEDGMLFISTNATCEKLLDSCGRINPNLDPSRMGIIDCTGQELGPTRHEALVRTVSTQSDLTGIGMKFSALYESLYASADRGRVRTGLVSLSSLSMYVDLRVLFRFAQTLSGRIESAGGLGVFSIDPSAHDDRTVNTLNGLADGRIDVRETGEADDELRVRGLPDQPRGWTPFSLS